MKTFENLIDCGQLAARLGEENYLVFDCRFDLADVERGERDYARGHIPGAVYAHLDRHLSSPITPTSGRHPMPDLTNLLAWLGRSGMHPGRQVVVYDDSFGAMAARLWWLLKCLGHDAVALLDGGWQAWRQGGFEINDYRVQPRAGSYHAALDWHNVVTTEQVLENLRAPEFLLVDVRTEERFLGVAEPIDPVAGHIPAAINIPLTRNIGSDGCFKPTHQLRELYADAVAVHDTTDQVYMCGSGVTACHSLVALCSAGYPMPRVYAGSWSEWIRDPERPVILQSAMS